MERTPERRRKVRTPKRFSLFHAAAGSIGGLLLLVAGCATGPDYHRPDLALPEAWRTTGTATNSLADLSYSDLYRDPVLNELITTALSNSPDVRSAIARIEEAAA